MSKATETMPQAKTAILRALAIDDNLAKRTLVGVNTCDLRFRRLAAERQNQRAIELQPPITCRTSGTATVVNTGRFERDWRKAAMAVDLDRCHRWPIWRCIQLTASS